MQRRLPYGQPTESLAAHLPRPCALLALLAATLALALPAPPVEAAAIDVIRDCSEDGSLDRNYAQKELRGALDELPSDLDEYTDCRSVIRRAQLSSAHGGKSRGKPKGVVAKVDPASPPSVREQRELEDAAGGAGAVEVGGRRVEPGQSGAPFAAAGLGTDLPTPLLVVLVALGLAMLAGAAFAAQRRWPAAGESVTATARRFADGVRRGITRRR
jgi:hypothetical protein